MRLHIGLAGALALSAALFASPGHARSIAVDELSTCSTQAAQPIALSTIVPVTPIGSASPGLGGNAYDNCVVDAAAGLSSGVGSNFLYELWDWVDAPPADVLGQPLSNLDNLGQLAELWLSSPGTYFDDYEIQFNYADFGLGNTTCAESSASLTWAGTTYTFTGAGAGGAGLCGVTDDFLFSESSGGVWSVFGVDAAGNVTAGPPAGWSVLSATAVPEPSTLLLLAGAALPLIIGLRGRRRRA